MNMHMHMHIRGGYPGIDLFRRHFRIKRGVDSQSILLRDV
jgi:hypothetical protein